VIEFKRGVYQSALDELSRLLFSEDELLRMQKMAQDNMVQAMESGLKIATAMLNSVKAGQAK
jgi:hypothetical protein